MTVDLHRIPFWFGTSVERAPMVTHLIRKTLRLLGKRPTLEELRAEMRSGRSIAAPLRSELRRRCSFADQRTLALGPADSFFDALIELTDKPAVPEQFAENKIGYVEASVEAVLRMLDVIDLDDSDLLCDVGSGLGRIPILVHLLTDRPTCGVELDPALASRAEQLAQKNSLSNVCLVEGSALDVDLSRVSVFSFNLPFDGEPLRQFLAAIRPPPGARPIRIYPYAWHLAFWDVPWLRPIAIPDTESFYFVSSR